MNIRALATCIGTAVFLAACSSGGSNNSSPGTPGSSTVQQVSGTLKIGLSVKGASNSARKPAYVSAATTHAAVFIDGAASAAGSTTTCSAVTGTGTGCTISWSAALTVPASHTFAVETDTGSNSPINTVLAEGAGSYAIVAGTNSLGTLSLNGVVVNASFTVTGCPSASVCNGNVTLSDAASDAIAYNGSTTVPTIGNSPSSGNVFDNGNVTFVSSNPSLGTGGLVTGTAQSPFSTFAPSTLTVAGVNLTGIYTYQVTCNTGTTGTFGITVGGAATPSDAVTALELSSLTTPVSYPLSGVTTLPTAPSFTCTGGVISSATGTLPVN